ncbi:MAG: DegT/DnrJ/EryC1/StrS family aminotransferase [Armatimonadetes bacterium]|nr:DegT/DnrJ/EryC1/StrS family aminotransferase [Armatimonadota bacterium]
MSDRTRLAINGGERTIPEGAIRGWPPIERIDREYVLASLDSGSHAFGPNCTAFEREFAAWNGNRFAITTNSGTAALHMAVAACGCGAGDEVIVPAYSWSSSATCVLHHNCIPVFVDIDYDTMNIDLDRLEAAVTERTRAVLVVHLHGLPVNMDGVARIADRHGLRVIEDACQAHGAKFKGRRVGLWGDCAAFSFNQNKCLCSGEGGMLVTDDEEVYERAKMVWSFGEARTPSEDRDYHAYALGWMYRNNDLTAAFGRAQLTRLDRYLEVQRRNAHALAEELSGIPGLILPVEPEGRLHNWYNYTLRVDPSACGYSGSETMFRDAVMAAVQAEGVPVGIWQRFTLPAMTVFQARNAYGRGCPWECPHSGPVSYDPGDFPVAQRHCDTHFGMTDPLRAPNDRSVARLVGMAIRKVFENLRDLDIRETAGGQ